MISSEPPPAAVAPLPVWPTIAEAYRIFFRNFPVFAKLAAIPMVLSMGLWITSPLISAPFSGLLFEILTELPWTLLGVTWLRRILLLESGTKVAFFPKLGRRHLRFLGYSLLLIVIDLPLLLFPVLAEGDPAGNPFGSLAFWGIYLASIYLELRFAFVYVAVAADETYSLTLAWRHSRGQSLRLFLVVGIAVVLPWRLFNTLLENIPLGPDNFGAALAVLVAWNLAFWVLQAGYLTLVALAFRTCTGWVPPPDRRLLERFE